MDARRIAKSLPAAPRTHWLRSITLGIQQDPRQSRGLLTRERWLRGKRFALSRITQRSVPMTFWTSRCECAMDRPSLPDLKIRSGASAAVLRPDVADLACLGELCQAFAEVTGWPLRYVPEPEPTEDLDLLWSAPVTPGVGESPGHLRIDLSGAAAAEVDRRSEQIMTSERRATDDSQWVLCSECYHCIYPCNGALPPKFSKRDQSLRRVHRVGAMKVTRFTENFRSQHPGDIR